MTEISLPTMRHAIIAGAPRCGTTSLFRYLSAHPEICPSHRKELNFFTEDHDIATYLENFWKLKPGCVTLEASPVYCLDDAALMRARVGLPQAKIVLIFRDPIDRLESHFIVQKDRSGLFPDTMEFPEFLELLIEPRASKFAEFEATAQEFLAASLYDEIIMRALAAFDPDQIHILFLENIDQDPCSSLKDLCEFLSIQPNFYDKFNFTQENKAINVRSRSVYKILLRFNQIFEPALNRAPALKRFGRSLHDHFNTSDGIPKPNARTRCEAETSLQQLLAGRMHAFSRMMEDIPISAEPAPPWTCGYSHAPDEA